MMPAVFPLQIVRGDRGWWQFTCYSDSAQTVAANLLGAQARAQIRDQPGGGFIANLRAWVVQPNLVSVEIPRSVSRFLPTQAAWDLRLNFGAGNVSTIVRGIVATTPSVTERLWR